jgi:hypothetical protein
LTGWRELVPVIDMAEVKAKKTAMITSRRAKAVNHVISAHRLGDASFRWEQAMGIELNVTRCDVMRRKVERGTGVWIMQGAAQPCGLQFQGLRVRPGNALESESA